jgi:hypothetical protein
VVIASACSTEDAGLNPASMQGFREYIAVLFVNIDLIWTVYAIYYDKQSHYDKQKNEGII